VSEAIQGALVILLAVATAIGGVGGLVVWFVYLARKSKVESDDMRRTAIEVAEQRRRDANPYHPQWCNGCEQVRYSADMRWTFDGAYLCLTCLAPPADQ
jgi:hypothetical protein